MRIPYFVVRISSFVFRKKKIFYGRRTTDDGRRIKGFTLIEVLIALIILTGGIVFIFRSFIISQTALGIFQDTTQACLLAEDKMLEIEEGYRKNIGVKDADSGEQIIQRKNFQWDYTIVGTDASALKNLELVISWQGRRSEDKRSLKFFTYLIKQ
jgi:type II secretion system protein I